MTKIRQTRVNESFRRLVTASETVPCMELTSLVIRDMRIPVGCFVKKDIDCP